MSPNAGTVFWLSGLSGSGKTTIGFALTQKLREQGHTVLFLDGDHLREMTGDVFGHSMEERYKASMLYARLCKLIADQGVHVVCATISLFHKTQSWNRSHNANYIEVFVDVPIDSLKLKDPKNIYANASAGTLKNVVGLDIEPQWPKHPDVVIKNDHQTTPQDYACKILETFNTMRSAAKTHQKD